MDVQIIDYMGTDLSVVNSARVSFGKSPDGAEDPGDYATELGEKEKGLISYMMRNKHASPFEHCAVTFFIETSIAVSREAMRHRTFSFNEFSTRYSQIDDDPESWYIPEADHMRQQKGKPGAYTFEVITEEATIDLVQQSMALAYSSAYHTYHLLLEDGVAKEIARNVLPLGMTTKFWMTGNLRNWFNFLVLRNSPHALQEIRDIAICIETDIAELFPECYSAWVAAGRIQI